MSTFAHDPRTAVMILAETSWEGPDGVPHKVPARIEDVSAGGACLRLQTPVEVGLRLRVQSRREEFLAVTKYCRRNGREFIVGVQRDKTTLHNVSADVSPAAITEKEAKNLVPIVPPPVVHSAPTEDDASHTMIAPRPETEALVPLAERPAEARPVLEKSETAPPAENEVVKTRKPMRNKLLELAHWRDRHGDRRENGNRDNGNGNRSPQTIPTAEAPAAVPAAPFEVELLPVDEIYRASGVMNVRHGIHRVIEMLRSEHIRGLSNEMKRAAVLMALDAAGIAVDEVLRDAKTRQTALDFYEANQTKQVEAEWARKAEENTQIQAELERVKAHYLARIARSEESVQREKITFASWLTKKQQESQTIVEAAALFAKPPAVENNLPAVKT